MKKFILTFVCLAVSVSASAQFTQSSQSASKAANKENNAGGSGVNTVDDKSFHKVVFSYSPMAWNLRGDWAVATKLDNQTFHNLGLLYTNSQLIARFPLYIEFGAGINWLTSSYSKSYTDKKSGDYTIKYKYDMFSLTVPVNIVYRLSFKGGTMHLAPYTGFYARVNIAGSAKYDDGSGWGDKNNLFSADDMEYNMDEPAFKRFQMGWQFGAAFDWKMLNVFLGYGVDFIPLQKYDDYGVSYRSSLNGVNLGIGVKF